MAVGGRSHQRPGAIKGPRGTWEQGQCQPAVGLLVPLVPIWHWRILSIRGTLCQPFLFPLVREKRAQGGPEKALPSLGPLRMHPWAQCLGSPTHGSATTPTDSLATPGTTRAFWGSAMRR